MKRLLLSLLAALALPTAVNADLGSADFPEIKTVFPIKKGKSKTIENQKEQLIKSISNEFVLNCGWILQRDFKKCKIQFKNGRLIVDNSYGINPYQIKDIKLSSWDGMTISYIDQNNIWKLARIQSPIPGDIKQELSLTPFITRLFVWVNTGKKNSY